MRLYEKSVLSESQRDMQPSVCECVRVFCLFVTVNSEINTSKLYVTRSMQPDNNSFSLKQIHTYYCLAQSPGKELVDLWPTSEDGPLLYSLHAAQKDMFVSTRLLS